MASVEATKAGGDQMALSRPPLTAAPMTGSSEAPLEHLASVTVCKTVCGLCVCVGGGWEQSRLHVLEPTFFRKSGRGGRDPGASTGVPNPPPGPPRRLAAQGGKGELCTPLISYQERGARARSAESRQREERGGPPVPGDNSTPSGFKTKNAT
jgi:hypothetical protein